MKGHNFTASQNMDTLVHKVIFMETCDTIEES